MSFDSLYASLAEALADPAVRKRVLAFVPQEGLPPVGSADRPPQAVLGDSTPAEYVEALNRTLTRAGLADTGTGGVLNEAVVGWLAALDARYPGALEDLRNPHLAYLGWEQPVEAARADDPAAFAALVDTIVSCWTELEQPAFNRRLLVAIYSHGQRFGGFDWEEGGKGLLNACPGSLVVPYLASLAIFHEAPSAAEFADIDGSPESTSAARRAFATRVAQEALVVRVFLAANEPPVDDPADPGVVRFLGRVLAATRGAAAMRYLRTYAMGVSERWARNETFKGASGEPRDARPANAAALAAHLA